MNLKRSQYNVFIFNFNDNNQRDIERLQKTFKDLGCNVYLHDQPNYNQFQDAIVYIRTKIFTIFEYVVLVVLANKNPGCNVLHTSDGQIVFIDRDLISRVEFNPTLRYKNKMLLALLQTNDNLLDNKQRLMEEYPIFPMKQQLGKCFSAASLESLGVKQEGITIRISAAEFDERLDDYWSEENPPVSPFIQAFCNIFGKCAESKDLNDIFCEICDCLPNCQPTMEVACGIPNLVLGKPVNPRLKKLYKL